MLPILHSPVRSSDDLERVSHVCLAAWRDEICPRVEAVLMAFPESVYPSVLLKGRLPEASLASLDALAGDANIKGVPLRRLPAKITAACNEATNQLALNAERPSVERQALAFKKVLVVRELLQELPRSVVIP